MVNKVLGKLLACESNMKPAVADNRKFRDNKDSDKS